MTSGTHYLNTDLDLNSEHDLGAIAKYLGDRGWSIHFAEQHPHGYWLGVFEHPNGHEVEPEKAIAAMLGVIDDFPHKGCVCSGQSVPNAISTSVIKRVPSRMPSNRPFPMIC